MNAPAPQSRQHPYRAVALGGLIVIAFGTALWVKFGSLVWFDTIAAAFIGCFI